MDTNIFWNSLLWENELETNWKVSNEIKSSCSFTIFFEIFLEDWNTLLVRN